MDRGSWKSPEGDIPIRLMIIRKTQEIFQTIQLPCDPDVFEDTLKTLAPRLEAELYRRANSLEEYGDPRTVRQRLENLAPQQGHVQPLEALWLQGLLNVDVPTNGAAPPAPIDPGPPQIPAIPFSTQDPFARSLIQAQRLLDHYDAMPSDVNLPVSSATQESASTPDAPMNLQCHENLDESP